MPMLWPLIGRRAAKMHRLVHAYAELGRFSGTVLVAQGDRVLFKRGYGMASYEHNVPNTLATSFRIGSQTKAFTAIAILQLQERGALNVHEPIATYLPGYPRGERISIQHLLTNMSGIPDYVTTETFSREMALAHSPDELIARFKDRPLLFEPGARFAYSNSGWVLLGAIIERLSGKSYADYLEHHICAPAGMTRSGVERPGQVLGNHAGGYQSLDKQVVRAAPIDNSTQFAAGDMHATAEDLYRWDRALHSDRLLGRASHELILAPYVETDLGMYGYGCGLFDRFGQRCFESSGGTIGFVSTTTRYLDDDSVIVVLSNFENGAFGEIERGLAAILFDQPYELPSARRFVSVDPAVFAAYIGRYQFSFIGRAHIMEVSSARDRLLVEVQGLPKTELRPMSATSYFTQMKGEVELTFLPTGGGKAQEIAVNWVGKSMTARRVA